MTSKNPKRKKRIGVDEYGRTPLHNSVIDEDIEETKKLIQSGIDINATDDDGWKPLHYACQNYNYEIVKALIENGSNMDPTDSYGNSPLFKAVFSCRHNSGDLIRYLIDNGAQPNLKNNNGVSPRDPAEKIANYDEIKFLNNNNTVPNGAYEQGG